MFKPQKPSQEVQQQRGRNRLPALSKSPDLHQIRVLLTEADRVRGLLCELPIKRSLPPTFVLTCQYDQGASEPIWTLYEGDDGSTVVWSYPSLNVEMIFDIVAMSILERSGTGGLDLQKPEPIRAPAPAPAPTPTPAPAPAPMQQQPPQGFPGQQPYPAQQPGYPPQPYPPQQPGYPPQQPGYPPGQPYPPQQPYPQQGWGPQQPGWGQPPMQAPWAQPPQQPGYAMPPGQYPPQPQPQPGPAPAAPYNPYNTGGYPTPGAAPAPAPAPSAPEVATPTPSFIDLMTQGGPNLLLGHLFVEAGVLPEPMIDSALKLQELVRHGKITNEEAIEALRKAAESGGRLEDEFVNMAAASRTNAAKPSGATAAPKAAPASATYNPNDPKELARRAIAMIQDAGIISEQDYKTAAGVRAKHGGDIGSILVAAGKMEKATLEAAKQSLPLVVEGRMTQDQAFQTIRHCQRTKAGFEQALQELSITIR